MLPGERIPESRAGMKDSDQSMTSQEPVKSSTVRMPKGLPALVVRVSRLRIMPAMG